MARTLLLTGNPGAGKTTVVKAVAEALGDRAGGFYTEEIRREGHREGFRLVTLDQREAVMAHVRLRAGGRPYVGRYGVDLQVIESVGVAALKAAAEGGRILIVDEIGKMELLCQPFREAVLEAIQGPGLVVATVMKKAHIWVDRLKRLQQVEMWEISEAKRDEAAELVLAWLDR